MTRQEMQARVAEIELEASLTWHLTGNFYPPYPIELVPVAKAAIEAGRDEEWDREILMPDGVTYKGGFSAPASAIIEDMRLEFYVD